MTERREGCAIVTGGNRGIGAATASALAAAGWPVGVIHRGGGEPATASFVATADLRDADATAAAFAQVQAALGPCLVLVNNAGVRHAPELAAALDDEAVADSLEVNVGAVFAATRLALRPMLRARWGRVVNIASVAGLVGSPGLAAYAAAKAGVISYTRTLALEVARRGITVNAVAPGLIETDMVAGMREELADAVPARRRGTPEDVAACVRFLVSEEASYVTGTTIAVDGGLSAGIDPTTIAGGAS